MGKPAGVLVVALVLGLVSIVAAIPGNATFYAPPYVPSSCYGLEDKGVMIATASDAIWNDGAACGHKYQVTCTGPMNEDLPQPCSRSSVIVTVVGYCSPTRSCRGTISLSQQAFHVIANPEAAQVQIDYTQLI